jgi:hypothetical protein
LKITVKEKIEFLKDEIYDVIAIDSRAIEFYLIQVDNEEFTWIESQYFDLQTIEEDNLIFEKLSEYSHQKVPEFLRKETRFLGINKYWSLNSSEFCDYISLNQQLQNNGFVICQSINTILRNESIQFQIIEQQINQVGKTLMLLGDGYFPTIVSVHRTTKENPKENIRQDFRLDFQQMRTDQKVTITQISNLDEVLDDLYQWSYNYVKGFSKYSGFFENDYWNNQILDMLNVSKMNLLVYANNWNPLITKYFIPQADGTEINLLQMENKNSKTTLRIQNVIH